MANKIINLEDDKTHLVEETKKLLGTDGRHKLSEVDGLQVFAVVQKGRVRRYEATDSSGHPAEVSFLKMRTGSAGAAAQGQWSCWMCHTHKDGTQHCFPIECPED